MGDLPEDLIRLLKQYEQIMQATLKSSASGSAAPDPISLRPSEIRALRELRDFHNLYFGSKKKLWFIPEVHRGMAWSSFERLVDVDLALSNSVDLRTQKTNWLGRILANLTMFLWCKDGILHQYRISEIGLAWLEARRL